jgi:hypothetical protein
MLGTRSRNDRYDHGISDYRGNKFPVFRVIISARIKVSAIIGGD